METSDSECFESADEEFYSDDEEKTVRAAPIPQKCTTPPVAKVKDLSIKDTETASKDKELRSYEDEKEPLTNTKANAVTSVAKESVTRPEKKDRQAKPKLGVKLGSKVKKSDLNMPEKDLDGTGEVILESKKTDVIDSELDPIVSNSENIDNLDNSRCVIPPPIENRLDSGDTKPVDNKKELEVSSEKKCSIPQGEEENMWQDDDWEPLSNTSEGCNTSTNDSKVNELKTDDFESNWTGWGNWGVSSLLSTATVGVTTITNHVSQGLTTVLESGIGAPEPEELARFHKTEKTNDLPPEASEGKRATTSNLSFGLGNFVSGVSHITKLVESTGTKVISGGLDTLETIGKKTMEVLQEGDPGLKKKRAFLKIEANKPVLSHMLREAKEKAENDNKLLEEKRFSKKANYETLFDDHQGLVHLEALEMLSKQCDIKLQTLLESQSGSELVEMQETMNQINELCELTEEDEEELLNVDDVKEKLSTAVAEMNVPIAYDRLIAVWVDVEEWLQNISLNLCDDIELHEQAIDTLAQLTAIAVEQFHKIGELLLIKEHRSTADEADSLVQLTGVLMMVIGSVATKLADKLNEKASTSQNKDRVSSLITNVYFEAANSSSYIKNAFQLLIPVLQVGAL